jgi:argininosuccinate lyase
MEKALTQDMLATDVAEYLVRKGVPFRHAHHAAGQAVQLSEQSGRSLSQLTVAEYKSINEAFEDDIAQPDWWTFERSVQSRDAVGGTNKQRNLEQIQSLSDWLDKNCS